MADSSTHDQPHPPPVARKPELSDDKYQRLRAPLLQALQPRCGAENAIVARELIKLVFQLGGPRIDDRELREAVLRIVTEDRICICSRTSASADGQKKAGYFIARTREEANECVDGLNWRGIHDMDHAKALAAARDANFPPTFQPQLI